MPRTKESKPSGWTKIKEPVTVHTLHKVLLNMRFQLLKIQKDLEKLEKKLDKLAKKNSNPRKKGLLKRVF